MSLIEVAFKSTWKFHVFEAPRFIWVASLLLVAFTFGTLVWFCWEVWREKRLHAAAAAKFRSLAREHPPQPTEGLPLDAFDSASVIFEETPSLRAAKQQFLAQQVLRRNIRGEDQVWVAQGAEAVVTDALVIDMRINRAFFRAIPGIVTGLGLLFTFMAILIALLDVRLTGSKQVEGLDLLIKGLSGKFISSIVALAVASVYLLLENPLLHRLSLSRQKLVESLNAFLPVLTPTQLLSDLVRDIAEQSTAFRSFNTDLSQKLRQSLSESMGPTLARMVNAVEDLNQLLRASEAQKQESITGSLEALMEKLETSVTTALGQMTSNFTESIAGGARTEFAGVIDSIRGTAGLLEKMNAQFTLTQHALGELTQLSKSATTEQIQLGKKQIEELTEVLRGLMTQLNETAGTSVSRMAATLTSVVHDLSTKVGELGDRMSSSILDSAGLATDAANEVIQKADQWSAKSAQQLADLLDVHHGQLDTVKGLRDNLENSLAGFKVALQEMAAVTRALNEIVANANAAVASIGGMVKNMRDSHGSVEKVAILAASQVEQLALANRTHTETWKQIQNSMGQYQQLFARVEKEASSLLGEIGKHLENFVVASKNGFEQLVKISDEHFTNATKRLGSSVNDLDEVLEVLTENLDKQRRVGAGSGR
ncbi:MAG: hypothetical protein AB1898_32855 [Acidobacteriota bacterium]